jgi:orotate phosphoribosyltransferase
MDHMETIRQRISIVTDVGGLQRHLTHPLNGRFQPVDRAALGALVRVIANCIDPARVDYVLGLPEGGSIPAYEFGRHIDRPVILASRLPVEMPGAIAFEEPHARVRGWTTYVYGVKAGDRVMILEDELTNGRSLVSAVHALRRQGIEIDQVGTLLAIDHPGLRRRMLAAEITLHIGLALPPEYAPRPIDDGSE